MAADVGVRGKPLYSLDKEDEEGEFERIRQSGRERLMELSRPKDIKIGYFTNVGPNVMWGTQEMLWPLNPNIQKASERVEQLATPKKDFSTVDSKGRPLFLYSCGRPHRYGMHHLGPSKKHLRECSS